MKGASGVMTGNIEISKAQLLKHTHGLLRNNFDMYKMKKRLPEGTEGLLGSDFGISKAKDQLMKG